MGLGPWQEHDVIRSRRRACGLSQQGLAAAVGASPRQVIRWEQGAAVPREEVRTRLADVLGGSAEDYGAVSPLAPLAARLVAAGSADEAARLRARIRRLEGRVEELEAALGALVEHVRGR